MGNRRNKKGRDKSSAPIDGAPEDGDHKMRTRDTEPVNIPETQAYEKPKKPEEILVVDRNHLFGAQQKNRFQGFMSAEEAGNRFLNVIYDSQRAYFTVRDPAEDDANKKQIIPYCVVYHTEFGVPRIFLMKRLPGGTEERLHDLYTIGVGGHINPVDEDEQSAFSDRWRIRPQDKEYLATPLWAGMRREFEEEVDCDSDRLPKIIGYINDDSNDVGKVHFGVVFLIRSARQEIYVNEQDQLEGRLLPLEGDDLEEMTVDELRREQEDKFKLENWSKIIYPSVKELLLYRK